MILMGMSEQDACDVAALLFEKADVGQDDVDARLILGAEGHAHIDDEPLINTAAAIAVEVEVHADFADAAKRHEDELVAFTIGFSGHWVQSALSAREEDVAGRDALLSVRRLEAQRAV